MYIYIYIVRSMFILNPRFKKLFGLSNYSTSAYQTTISSVHPHRISLTTLRSEGLIVQHQPMLMIKRPADHDKVNPQKATTAHMWTTTLLQATKRSARHRETWTKTETSWVHPSHNKTETCTQTPVSTPQVAGGDGGGKLSKRCYES